MDKDVRFILAGWAVVYYLDLAIGGVFFQDYPMYYVYSIWTGIVITTFTVQAMSDQWVKALIIVGLSYIDIFIMSYEIICQWPDWFYPHISTISWWIIEIQLITLICNVKFKAPTTR